MKQGFSDQLQETQPKTLFLIDLNYAPSGLGRTTHCFGAEVDLYSPLKAPCFYLNMWLTFSLHIDIPSLTSLQKVTCIHQDVLTLFFSFLE